MREVIVSVLPLSSSADFMCPVEMIPMVGKPRSVSSMARLKRGSVLVCLQVTDMFLDGDAYRTKQTHLTLLLYLVVCVQAVF